MAKYDYKCKKCNKEIEITKPMKDATKEEFCSECGEKLERIITGARSVWKCSGSYSSKSI